MAGAVPAQRLLQAAQHQLLVFRQHHIDKIDHDHSAQIAQAHLADDLLCRLQVVLGHRLFQVAARAGELAGVDVDNGHRLGAVNDQRAARRQPHLPGQRLVQLLLHAVGRERIVAIVGPAVEAHHAVGQVRRHRIHVRVHRVVGALAIHDELVEVLVEQVAHDLDEHVRLLVESNRFRALGLLFLLCGRANVFPPIVQAAHVSGDGLLRDVFRGCTDDGAAVVRHHAAQDVLQTLALRGRQLARNAGVFPLRHVHQETASEGNLRGQARALVPQRILGHLDQNLVTRLQRVFDLARTTSQAGAAPVKVTCVEHAVAASADVHERRLHRRQYVLHPTQVDIADDGRLRLRGHEVLDEQPVLQDADLGDKARAIVTLAIADHHEPLHRLPAREELRLGDDVGALAPAVAHLRPPAAARLNAGGAADGLGLVDDLHAVVVARGLVLAGALGCALRGSLGGSPAPRGAAAPAAPAPALVVGVFRSGHDSVERLVDLVVVVLVGVALPRRTVIHRRGQENWGVVVAVGVLPLGVGVGIGRIPIRVRVCVRVRIARACVFSLIRPRGTREDDRVGLIVEGVVFFCRELLLDPLFNLRDLVGHVIAHVQAQLRVLGLVIRGICIDAGVRVCGLRPALGQLRIHLLADLRQLVGHVLAHARAQLFFGNGGGIGLRGGIVSGATAGGGCLVVGGRLFGVCGLNLASLRTRCRLLRRPALAAARRLFGLRRLFLLRVLVSGFLVRRVRFFCRRVLCCGLLRRLFRLLRCRFFRDLLRGGLFLGVRLLGRLGSGIILLRLRCDVVEHVAHLVWRQRGLRHLLHTLVGQDAHQLLGRDAQLLG